MKKLYTLIFPVLISISTAAQIKTNPYTYNQHQRISSKIYSLDSRLHSSIKPVQLDDTTSLSFFDSLSLLTIDTSRKRSLIMRKLFSEHLIEIEKEDFNVYIDFLPDFQIGRDVESKRTTWLNTRGFQLQGNIGRKFTFYTSAYENQSKFPAYLTTFINKNGIIPGIVNDKFPARDTKDWAWASAVINYTPNKYFSFSFGQDKHFIGDGYRSMLLSDVSANYPFFKIVTTLGNIKYMNIWQLPSFLMIMDSERNGAFFITWIGM
jgi:hypothetical protein